MNSPAHHFRDTGWGGGPRLGSIAHVVTEGGLSWPTFRAQCWRAQYSLTRLTLVLRYDPFIGFHNHWAYCYWTNFYPIPIITTLRAHIQCFLWLGPSLRMWRWTSPRLWPEGLTVCSMNQTFYLSRGCQRCMNIIQGGADKLTSPAALSLFP